METTYNTVADGVAATPIVSAIWAWLDRDGATISGLAKMLDVHRNSIRNWRDGASEPDDATLVRLLDAIGATQQERRAIWTLRLGVDQTRLIQVIGGLDLR